MILLGLLVLLQVLDFYTTKKIIEHGGVEYNPLVAFGMKHLGRDAFLILKGFIVVYIGWELLQLSPVALGVLALLYSLVILNNWNAIRKGNM